MCLPYLKNFVDLSELERKEELSPGSDENLGNAMSSRESKYLVQ